MFDLFSLALVDSCRSLSPLAKLHSSSVMERHHLEYSKTLMENEVGAHMLIFMRLSLWKQYLKCADVFHAVLSNLILLPFFTEPEYLPEPPEASVWDGAASVWSLHHCHWSRPVLQVRNVRRVCVTLSTIFKDFWKDLTAFSSFRKRTMFQKIVDAVEGIPEEKEKISYVSNNATRKEIIM